MSPDDYLCVMGIDPAQAREHFARLRQRPSMYVYAPDGDWKYVTALGYVDGWFAGVDPTYGIGRAFSEWLGRPSIVWWGTIVDRRHPDRAPASLSSFSREEDQALIDDLFDALDGFFASLQA